MDKDIQFYQDRIAGIEGNMEQERLLIQKHRDAIAEIEKKKECEYFHERKVQDEPVCNLCCPDGCPFNFKDCDEYKIMKTTALIEGIEVQVREGSLSNSPIHDDVKKLLMVLKGETDADSKSQVD